VATSEKTIVACPCGAKYEVPRSAVGKSVNCPKCGKRFDLSGGPPPPLPKETKIGETPDNRKGDFGQVHDWLRSVSACLRGSSLRLSERRGHFDRFLKWLIVIVFAWERGGDGSKAGHEGAITSSHAPP
jgi:hypothetical protein